MERDGFFEPFKVAPLELRLAHPPFVAAAMRVPWRPLANICAGLISIALALMNRGRLKMNWIELRRDFGVSCLGTHNTGGWQEKSSTSFFATVCIHPIFARHSSWRASRSPWTTPWIPSRQRNFGGAPVGWIETSVPWHADGGRDKLTASVIWSGTDKTSEALEAVLKKAASVPKSSNHRAVRFELYCPAGLTGL